MINIGTGLETSLNSTTALITKPTCGEAIREKGRDQIRSDVLQILDERVTE